jgi:uroporphyrinogen-III synthase
MTTALDGLTVAVTERRFAPELGLLFERAGARVLHCPLLQEKPVEHEGGAGKFVEIVKSGTATTAIFFTGVGVNFILDADPAGKESLLRALSRMTVVARGSKTNAALKRAGVRIDIVPQEATTEGLIESLRGHELSGQRIVIQLYGTPNPVLCAALQARGAEALPVSIYTYEEASDADAVQQLLRAVLDGSVQILTFTSAPQVRFLFQAAEEGHVARALGERLRGSILVAAIGEVTCRALEQAGVNAHVVPPEPKMAPLVKAISDFVVSRNDTCSIPSF